MSKLILSLDEGGINADKCEFQSKSSLVRSKLESSKIGIVPSQQRVLPVTYSIKPLEPVVIKSTETTQQKRPLGSLPIVQARLPPIFLFVTAWFFLAMSLWFYRWPLR